MGVNLSDPITAVYELSQVDHASYRMAVSIPATGGSALWYHSGCAMEALLYGGTFPGSDHDMLTRGDARLTGSPTKHQICLRCRGPVHRPRKKR